MTKQILKISGMTCDGCVKSVTRVLERVEGVEGVTVSLEAETASVNVGEGVEVGALVDAVERAGFEATAEG